MVIIAVGVYSDADRIKVEESISKVPQLRIVWDYETVKIDEEEGLSSLKEYFKLYKIGIVVHETDFRQCQSYTLIDEISHYYIQDNPYPSFFHFIDTLELDYFVLAFADEWERDDLIRLEKLPLKDVKERLLSVYVWCEQYLNFQTNVLSFDDTHPLVLDIRS